MRPSTVITSLLFTLITAFILPLNIKAQDAPHLRCEAGDLRATNTSGGEQNVQAYDGIVCIGGFASLEAAKQPMTISIDCLAHSNSPLGIEVCRAENAVIETTPQYAAGEDTNGDGRMDNYYTCYEIQEINRDVGTFQVIFNTAEGQCSTRAINSRPSNYDTWHEGFLGVVNGGDNFGQGVSSHLCVDGTINTAIGCIDYEIIPFIQFLLGWALGVGGGVALVLIGYSGIMFMFSKGDPGMVSEAKSIFIAAISGLLLVIFSTFLLRALGVSILELF